MPGQGEADRMRMGMRTRLAVAALAFCALHASRAHAGGAERITPSGLPVPRYVSLKFDKVNARAGPGDDHRLLWVYRIRGLPLQVVAETAEWRRVCDPEGELAWVHKRTTDGRRMVMNTTLIAAPLRARPKEISHVNAYLKPRALATLVRCDKAWCRVRVDDASGWVHAGDLWGTAEAVQCRPGQTQARLGH
jgi:SH3-like domain-containing protein